MKKITIYSILFCFLFGAFYVFNANYIVNKYQPKILKVHIEVVTPEEDIFQLYYRESTGKLNEGLSEKIRVIASKDVQKLQFNIPDTLEVSHFRFDFGNMGHESDVKINEIVFSYNGNNEFINSNLIKDFFRINKYAEQHDNCFSRKVIKGRSDPFLLSVDLEKLINCLKERPNYRRTIINILLSALLSFCLCIAVFHYLRNNSLMGLNEILFVFIFIMILIMPHIDEFFDLDKTAISEKRELKKKPEITIDNYDEFPENFETYYNDNFGFRKKMVSLGAILKIKIFNSTPNFNSVIVGKEDWLFYWKNDIIKNSYLNKNPFKSDELGKFGSSFLDFKNFVEQKNNYFLATVYPNKHTIYENKIPNRIRKIKQDTLKRIDQFYDFLDKNNISNVDHRDILIKYKNEQQLYLKNDSHWNAKGAYYAYHNIISAISNQDSMVPPPFTREEFNLIEVENYQGGDLLPILGIDNSFGFFTDTYIKHPAPKTYFKSHEAAYGKGTLLIENLKSDNNKTAVFFGDSYSKELIKFLPVHFRKTILISNIRLDIQKIEKIDPDIIVYGIVERNLENFN